MDDLGTFRIKFAYFHSSWDRESDSVQVLKSQGRRVLPHEFTSDMDGFIFCPECHTPISRRPKNKEKMRNGRNASFVHLPSFRHIGCNLRVNKSTGRRFETEEEAKKAIADEQLAIISGFIFERPEIKDTKKGKFEHSFIEDIDGEVSDVPISRHTGQSFKLPSKITTVSGLCRNFDDNYYKYFVFPGDTNARRLDSILVDINLVNEICDTPKLYFGRIQSSSSGPWDHSIRMTKISWRKTGEYLDFYFKQNNKDSKDHGINDNSRGRIILMYGKVERSGLGLCLNNVGWGEFSLLPEKYNYLLE
ncbi:hypothetical protein [Serratia marcescens]|uniref:hypothetical protein n=3 Tax=Serratia marcescens TaxID=615 RepID=UPI0011B49A63|nr:hypothetical protein [Serratia marcescens]MDI9106548.1 hypothetical protein [Serratia marcescens]